MAKRRKIPDPPSSPRGASDSDAASAAEPGLHLANHFLIAMPGLPVRPIDDLIHLLTGQNRSSPRDSQSHRHLSRAAFAPWIVDGNAHVMRTALRRRNVGIG